MNDAQLLPQMSGKVFVTGGGIETDLIFNCGIELPEFASFVLHNAAKGERELTRYFAQCHLVHGRNRRLTPRRHRAGDRNPHGRV